MHQFILALFSLTVTTATVAAEQIPNLVGTWEGQAASVVMGGGRHHQPGAIADISFVHKKFSYVIERQEGTNLVGYITNETNQFREAMIGAIHPDGHKGIFQDEDGRSLFDLVGTDEMALCYSHTSTESRVAACFTLVRKP